MSVKVSIIIPNWNGKAFLSRCLSAVLQSAAEFGHSYECLLMDDASTDNSGFEAREQFPETVFVRYDTNQGFGHMVNQGAQRATGDILVLVNNDLVARPQFISGLCRHFDDSAVLFGVSGKTVDWENGYPNHVNMRGWFTDGNVKLTWSDDTQTTETMFLQGGACAVRRDLFLQLGGFCALYTPGYWEDYDISYHALKCGFKNLYEPAAIGSHLGQGSMIRAHGRDMIEFVKARNKQLFQALNLTGEAEHKAFWNSIPNYVRKGEDARFKHRLGTLQYLYDQRFAIQSERVRRAEQQQLSDTEVFAKFHGLGTLC